jgi:hypothetical protein
MTGQESRLVVVTWEYVYLLKSGRWRVTCSRMHCHNGQSNHSTTSAIFSITYPPSKVARFL